MNKFLKDGFIPIIDLKCFKNIFNGYNTSSIDKNPWEYFFHQPFGFTLNNVLKNAKFKRYYHCKTNYFRPDLDIFSNKVLNDYWHNIAKIYIPLKLEIINEIDQIIKKLFKSSKNILGILVRGTDYISLKPKNHPIPPNNEIVIKDIIELDKKNKYEFFFISTEDDFIRELFIKKFGYKLKYLIYRKKINYNYKKGQYLGFNKNVKGNIQFSKIYLLEYNIII